MSEWNKRFTHLIRGSRPDLWGNWALAPHLQTGAVGVLDPSSGSFKLVAEAVPQARFLDRAASSTWKLSSEGVSRHQADARAEAAFVDPNTGLKVKPELAYTWKFQKKQSLVSEFAIAHESVISDLGVLSGQYEWLLRQAQKVGFARDGRIVQGFGVITGVVYANSGVNLGANEQDASYTLGGTAEGLHALLGDKGPAGRLKASYGYGRETRSLDKHLWPAAEGTVPSSVIPIAFAFSSFEGTTLLPSWRCRVERLAIYLDSKASKITTYVVKAKLSYYLNGKRHQEPVITITGGLSGAFADIPLSATRMTLELVFKGVLRDEKRVMSWDMPLGQWPKGEMHLDITGTWPGSPKVTIRDDLNNA
ncbi:hypothetical protein [Pseudomonas sp. DC3000-4b1]|uniref:hypothetical protein n=1 Tax=unclassified Pseudomonas TaxID=196821 RepID=UPI003CF40CB2